MLFFRRVVCVVLVFALFSGSTFAGQFVDTLGKGPPVGAKIPHSLKARDQNGQACEFKSLVGRRGLILHFYRPMVLCPSCEIQAGQWAARTGEFRAIGYNLAGVSNDPGEILSQATLRRNIDFPLLSDPGSEIIRAFGLLDDRYGKDSAWTGVALPMIFVIDANGVITHRFSSPDFRDRPDVDDVLDLLAKKPQG